MSELLRLLWQWSVLRTDAGKWQVKTERAFWKFMKRKLVPGRLDRGDEGEGQQKDNPGVIELQYHRGRLLLVRTGEGN